MDKLKASEVAAFRNRLLAEQEGRCAVCKNPLSADEAVLDHNHTTGEVRGVLHRGCNSTLGKIENHMKIAKLTAPGVLARFLAGVVPYLFKQEYTGVRYPTHRDEDEARLRRNKLARKRRAAAKENAA